MRAIVTGSSGFIGTNLVTALLARGDTVRCLVRGASPPPAERDPRVTHHLVNYSYRDLRCSPDVFADVDVVFHVAGQTNALTKADFERANSQPVAMLLEALHAAGARPSRFVLISSLAAAGPAQSLDQPRTETMPSVPMEAYGESKRGAETVLMARCADTPFTIIRPAAVYGPGDRGFLPIFRMVRRGLAIYPGLRDRWVSMIAIDDLIAGILAASSADAARNGTFFVAHPTPHQWRDVYRAAAGVAGRQRLLEINVPQAVVDVAARGGDLWSSITGRVGLLNRNKIALGTPEFWVCSCDLAAQAFGFQCRANLEEGLRRTYDWYRARDWI